MQISFDSFKSLIEGKNDKIKIDILDDKTWNHLWEDYLDEAKKFNSKQLKSIFGNEFHAFKRPDLNDRLNITEADKLLIGEFIRRNHPRIAHEVALKGLVGKNNEILDFAKDCDLYIKQLSGIIARSHGIEIRDTFEYLQSLSKDEWAKPYSINVTFLMVVLRIADYFQFDSSRIDKKLLKLKTFASPISEAEHNKHLSIEFVKTSSNDPETLHIESKPNDSILFLKLVQLFKSIQYELDISWAILGEIYGKEKIENQPQIKYRRIKSNLDKNGNFANSVTYVAEKVSFEYDSDLAKLLIAPLYGNNPTYGVRELLQNSIDACKEKEIEEKKAGNDYDSLIKVSIIEENNLNYFIIEDNGKGMTLSELQNYFLKAGSSFRKSIDWQKKYTTEEGKSEVMRSGRFGVGVLAAFLLGDEIEVETFNINESFTYSFTAKLDSEQLNIEKKEASIPGTKIKILLETGKLKTLLESNWKSWYRFNKPKIQFFEKGIQKLITNLINPNNISEKAHELFPQDFDKVIWTYENPSQTTCNGIIIPRRYSYSNEIFTREVKNSPSIHIIDSNAKLELNLSREAISGVLPFENMLIENIYKDFIAYLLNVIPKHMIFMNKLMINQKNTETLKHSSGIDSFNKVYYCKNGFVFDNEFFGSNFRGKKRHLHIDFLENKMPVDPIFDFKNIDLSNYLLSFDNSLTIENSSSYINAIGRLSTGYLQLNRSSRIYHSQKIFDSLFRGKMKVFHEIERTHIIEEQKNEWIIWSYINDTNPIFLLDFLKDSIPFISYIKDTLFAKDYYYSKHSKILSSLLTKYFGSNYIIPYELKDRKKMYPKAFEELEPYMRKYLTNS